MRERRSEIFEEYAKIAEEKGLYSKTPGTIDNKNNGDGSWARWDAEEISTTEALYGIKPNKDRENGTKNMMEQAHPDSVVIAPAYDRINGLVENNIERQKIIINILSRPPTGNANYRKLARQELLMELVRLGNHLDNTGQNELRVLADSCIEKLVKDADQDNDSNEVTAIQNVPDPADVSAADDSSDQNDVSPKGWGKTVEKMKKHKDLDNPFALANWMKNEHYKPHPNKKSKKK